MVLKSCMSSIFSCKCKAVYYVPTVERMVYTGKKILLENRVTDLSDAR